MTIIILDCETTGFDEPQAIEVAYLRLEYPSLKSSCERDFFFKPTKPISFGAMATHHILPSELVVCDEHGSEAYHELIYPITTADYIIAHNVDFDWKVLGSPDVKRICTLAIARKLLPELDSHSQSALMYYFFGDEAREMIKNAHNALVDIQNCLKVLKKLLEVFYNSNYCTQGSIETIDLLWEFSEFCRIPEKMTFGKHKGKTYLEVAKTDPGYFDWWRTKSDTPPNEYETKAIITALKVRK